MALQLPLGPIITDLDGPALTDDERKLLCEPAIGGVVLFARNLVSADQIKALTAEIRSLRNPSLLVTMDHEGGRVQRTNEGVTVIPPMRSIGDLHDKDRTRSLEESFSTGKLIASELTGLGIDLGFAPCVDIDHGVSDVIGDRAFHHDPSVVTELAVPYCKGLEAGGMRAVAKHFPGHGAVRADSHHELPTDTRQMHDVMVDAAPFAQLIEHRLTTGIMVSHVVYEDVDSLPASLSKRWISEELRNKFGFDGAVISDDLSMKAVSQFGSVAECAVMACDAGCDMVIICHDREATVEAIGHLSHPVKNSTQGRRESLRATIDETDKQ